jgi:probable F420-dependent oxidoreductase
MVARQFRFGVNLLGVGSRTEWQAKAKRAEDLGYDVILVPDHLGMLAPFPSLVAAAEVTSRPRLGTLVLNAGFYKPALLAREVAGTDQLVDGRLEIGLGAGHVKEEFDDAELPFPNAGQRVDYLEHTVIELRRRLIDDKHVPAIAQRAVPPIMIGGHRDRLLRLAARHADIISLAGVDPRGHLGETNPGEAALAERITFIRSAAGDRTAEIELNLMISSVVLERRELDLSLPRRFFPDLSDEALLGLPGVLHGSQQAIAEVLYEYREIYGLTYFAVTEPAMTDFAQVISHM